MYKYLCANRFINSCNKCSTLFIITNKLHIIKTTHCCLTHFKKVVSPIVPTQQLILAQRGFYDVLVLLLCYSSG